MIAGFLRTSFFELAAHVFQPSLRSSSLTLARATTLRRGLPHGLRRLLQLPRRLFELAVVVLTRETLELAGGLLDLFRQVPLRLAATATTC